HSVQQLRSQGIQPNFIICRCEREIEQDLLDKVALFCDVETDRVLTAVDAESLCMVPADLQRQGFDVKVLERFGMDLGTSDMTAWEAYCRKTREITDSIRIALVGKYVQLPDAYLSVSEALAHAGFSRDLQVQIEWIDSANLGTDEMRERLKGVDGILVPGGFGSRGADGKIEAIRYARENNIPFLGICLGMQAAVLEFARNVAGIERASSLEFDPGTPNPVIHVLPGKEGSENTGGSMRLGAVDIKLKEGTLAAEIYDSLDISERHRHRCGINNDYKDRLEDAGLVFSGYCEDGKIIEMMELPRDVHPWFVGTQGHPEFKSRAVRPAPLFGAFIDAAIKKNSTAGKT
ncbi:MAG: CTP synthase, partial [Coriobacteriia bacterium]|nr:CTP synthase [Coriobacteriia bacterium]